MFIAILSKLNGLRAESDPLQLTSGMQIALFATLLSVAFTSKNVDNEFELLIPNKEDVTTGSTAIVDSLPAAAEASELRNEKILTDEGISKIKAALSPVSSQIDEEKASENSLLEVVEDKGADIQEEHSSSSQDEDAKSDTNNTVDLNESSAAELADSRIPKSRFNRKNPVLESENSFEEKRMEIIDRMDVFIKKHQKHPLNKLVSTLMKTLSFFDEARMSKAWTDFGKSRRTFILMCFSKFVRELVTLNNYFFHSTEKLCPIVHYEENGGGPVSIVSFNWFDKIVKPCEKLMNKTNGDSNPAAKLEKRDFLVFLEVLFDLIDENKHYNAVEVDIFSPLYEVLKEVSKPSCGRVSHSSFGKQLNGSYLQIIQELKNDLKEVKALLTHDNRNNRGFLKINRFQQPRAVSSSNVPQARPRSHENQFISMVADRFVPLQILIFTASLLVLFLQVFTLTTKWA